MWWTCMDNAQDSAIVPFLQIWTATSHEAYAFGSLRMTAK